MLCARNWLPIIKEQVPGKHHAKMAQHLNDKGKSDQAATNHQRSVAKWTREDLEDRYFRVYEESIILKKHGRKQEDKIKRLTTKLLKVISDRKKLEQDSHKDGIGGKKRDFETEQMIEDMQDRIRELERQNKLLHEKLIVARQQLTMQLKRPVPSVYRHISSRLNTGIPKQAMKMQAYSHGSEREIRSPYTYDRSPVENNETDGNVPRDENNALFKRQTAAYEQEIKSLKELLHVKEIEHEEDIIAVKSQLTQDQRQLLQENISVIRLQRELKHRASQLMATETHCAELEKKLDASRKSYEQVLTELDALGQELKSEQQRNLTLQDEIKKLVSSSLIIAEMRENISDLEKENKILKDSNNVLLTSALNSGEKENAASMNISNKSQITKLEDALNVANEVNNSLTKLNKERDKELLELRNSYTHLQEVYDDLKGKLHLFSKGSDINLGELEEALAVIYRRKENVLQSQLSSNSGEYENIDALKQQLLKTQAEHVETISELEKTRNMLVVQNRINREYQQEVENVTSRISTLKKEYEERISEQAKLLELRSASIDKLEQQLNDISRGTNHFYSNPEPNVESSIELHYTQKSSTPKNVVPELQGNVAEIHQDSYNDALTQNVAVEASVESTVLPDKERISMLPPKPKPRNLSASMKQNDALQRTNKKPPFPLRVVDTKRNNVVQEVKDGPVYDSSQPSTSKLSDQYIIENSSGSSSISGASSDSESDAVVISAGANRNQGGEPMQQKRRVDINSTAVNGAGSNEDSSDESLVESDSEIVISREPHTLSDKNIKTKYTVVITVCHLTLLESAAILKDDEVQMLFVEYKFLDFPLEELETPFALPKPKPNQKIVFNFTKMFDLDPTKSNRLQSLANMLALPSKRKLRFTVVSEPPEGSHDIECEDIGYAYVDLMKILRNQKDIIEENIAVYDARKPSVIIGHLNLTVNAFLTLQSAPMLES